ncbi:MAG: iron-containing alcohol dehydrogenase [Saccharofermentanales bacterium]
MKEFSNFKFHMYTDILFGKDTEQQVAEMIIKHGGKKVMLVYGGGSIKKSGLYDTVVTKLNEAGLKFVELAGVQPNPRRSMAEKGLKLAQAENVDFLLGLGGASSIDTAKAIAMGLANDGEFWQFYRGVEPKKMAPVGTIHTIAAAGSETSRSSVLLDDIETHRKYGFMWDACRPVFAIMNPELTYSLPAYQTGVGAADIVAHTVNRYFVAPASYLGDQYAEGTLRTVVKYAPIALAKPNDYEARAELMLAGSFSHNDLTSIGRFSVKKGAEHTLETQLSGKYDTSHGAGLAVVMPAWLQYLVNHGEQIHVERVAQFGVNVFGVEPGSDLKAVANEGLNRFRAWLTSIGMPITLKQLGIPVEDLDDVIKNCNSNADGIIVSFLDLDKKAVAEIFTSALE